MPRCMCLLVLVLLIGPVSADPRHAAADVPRVYLEEFHLTDGAPFALPFWMEAPADTSQMLAEAGCQSLGFGCSDEPDARPQAIRYVRPAIESGHYRGTARLVRVRKDNYYAKLVAPPGFTTCRAGIYLQGGRISAGATFGGAIQRSGMDGLALYADLGNGAGKPARIEFRLLVQYVPDDQAGDARCWPDQTIIFLCRGESACQANRSYPETSLR